MCDNEQSSALEGYAPQLIVGDAVENLRRLPAQSVDLIVSSPPYNIRKEYERDQRLTLEAYLDWQREVLTEAERVLKDGGSICWQAGTYVSEGIVLPLDIPFYEILRSLGLKLRNRIIWKFNFGKHSIQKFSGRYETILWFTKGDGYTFNLDPVRIPQLYPGKRHSASRGGSAGKPSGNPKGKNPSDYWEFSAERDFLENPVWDFPNVKNNHVEKQDHPCQFPIELAERCILALSSVNDLVFDPFVGVGSTVLAAQKHRRKSIGVDKQEEYILVARERAEQLRLGKLPMRPIGKPVARPSKGSKVAQMPEEWKAVEK